MERAATTPKAMAALGTAIARDLGPRSVVLLSGPLGAGKTTLARGIIRALGGSRAVGSPTFNIVREYRGKEKTVYHADLYRLLGKPPRELAFLQDYFQDEAVTIVEWPEPIEGFVDPATAVCVTIEIAKKGRIVRW